MKANPRFVLLFWSSKQAQNAENEDRRKKNKVSGSKRRANLILSPTSNRSPRECCPRWYSRGPEQISSSGWYLLATEKSASMGRTDGEQRIVQGINQLKSRPIAQGEQKETMKDLRSERTRERS